MIKFTIGRQVHLEESLTCEFKEVKAQPLQAIGKVVDRHVVAFLNAEGGSIFWGVRDDRVVTGFKAPHELRDELRQVVGQKISSIAPSIPGTMVVAPFHEVVDVRGEIVADTRILEVRVRKPQSPCLYLTGNGEAYRRTLGGVKKLTGAELFLALSPPLQEKLPEKDNKSFSTAFPTIYRRAKLVDRS